MKKDLLSIKDLDFEDIESIFSISADLKQRRKKPQGVQFAPLRGKTLAMIFEKASTRTRISFEVGMYQLGGKALYLDKDDLQMGRGEPLEDTARILSRYVDAVLVRTYEQKEVVVLHIQAKMRFREIAKLQSTSIKTVQSRYRYGITKLRSMLDGEVKE